MDRIITEESMKTVETPSPFRQLSDDSGCKKRLKNFEKTRGITSCHHTETIDSISKSLANLLMPQFSMQMGLF